MGPSGLSPHGLTPRMQVPLLRRAVPHRLGVVGEFGGKMLRVQWELSEGGAGAVEEGS